jgi:tRNA(Glu) U13 pseudouridine synthase TruD
LSEKDGALVSAGTRRHAQAFALEEPTWQPEMSSTTGVNSASGAHPAMGVLSIALPTGVYATVLLQALGVDVPEGVARAIESG